MLDAPREQLVDRIPDEAEAQETWQELGDQSAAGWASGMSAPDLPLGPRRTSARCRTDNSQALSEDTGSTQGSTFMEDDATVSSMGNPEGTYDLGAPAKESDAMRQTNQDGTLPKNEPWNHALRRNQPIGNAMMIPKPGGRKRTRFCMQNPNGIQVTLGGKWKENCKHQKDMEVDWMGYSGSDLNTGNKAVMWRLKEDADAVFGHNSSKIATSHTNRESSNNQKPAWPWLLGV